MQFFIRYQLQKPISRHGVNVKVISVDNKKCVMKQYKVYSC